MLFKAGSRYLWRPSQRELQEQKDTDEAARQERGIRNVLTSFCARESRHVPMPPTAQTSTEVEGCETGNGGEGDLVKQSLNDTRSYGKRKNPRVRGQRVVGNEEYH